jgi:hypothetical protein
MQIIHLLNINSLHYLLYVKVAGPSTLYLLGWVDRCAVHTAQRTAHHPASAVLTTRLRCVGLLYNNDHPQQRSMFTRVYIFNDNRG